jgi:hypothetical protein
MVKGSTPSEKEDFLAEEVVPPLAFTEGDIELWALLLKLGSLASHAACNSLGFCADIL